MANWSQSHFLQSLGWATLNSFWQMALLWCVFLAVNSIFKTSSHRRYQMAVGAIITGFVWFAFTFLYYYNSISIATISIFSKTISGSDNLLNIFLLSASLAYLILLIFPSYRLFRNWQFVQRIKNNGLHKADFNYRLFVQKIAAHIGIGKKVFVYISELVTSPVTIGYLKPIILLPAAAFSNLSPVQVEAILLHELSHIRRYDYLVNLMISIIGTFLYFNPFVKSFIRVIEDERENCCDELVLQFGYDKMGYASALLTLEKLSISRHALALGAAGKKSYLLHRIEKIVGMEQKKRSSRSQFAGLLAALFCIVAFNSILIIKDTKTQNSFYSSIELANPFNIIENTAGPKANYLLPTPGKADISTADAAKDEYNNNTAPVMQYEDVQEDPLHVNDMIVQVAGDEIGLSLTNEEKEKVKTTVNATKKVLGDLQWKEVETVIADVLTEDEKVEAKKEFLGELNKTIDWKNVEQNIRAQYDNIDWQKMDNKVNNALMALQLDSLQKRYTLILNELNKATSETKEDVEISLCPLPDQSLEQIQKTKEELSDRVNTIKAIRSPKKVVRL